MDPESVSDEEMRGFSWITFKENVAIALAVAELVRRRPARPRCAGMCGAPPDPGVAHRRAYSRRDGTRLAFANVFAANDPESTLMNIDLLARPRR